MKERCMQLGVICFSVMIFLYGEVSSLPSPGDPACSLNFTSFPYKPIGGCNHNIQEQIKDWNNFPKTSCCQNSLLVFAHALALHAVKISPQNIFINLDQWINCSGPFRLQPNMSANTCGFDGIFYGNGKCSLLELRNIDRKVVDKCSLYGSSSFDDACGNCTNAISSEVESLLGDLGVKGSDSEEAAICVVAVVIAVLAGKMNGTFGIDDDFNRCLPNLANPEPVNYIKVKNSLSEALLALILATIAVTAVIVLIKHTAKKRRKEEKEVLSKELATKCSGMYRFSKSEIENALNYTTERKYLGRGSAGQVYKGMLPSGQLVAIKQLFQTNTSDSFVREIDGLSRVRHLNLVCLFGCCIADGVQYLVYEYCPNGNLAHHLLRKDSALTWELRVKILRDCASALKYLHYHIDGCIVHRDIKLTNILLTHNMEPKLSDFGLFKLLGMEESKVFTDVRGTIGYMDPEYMTNAKLTCASDIYSFGIVILQLLSGQRVIEFDIDARDQLTRKAKDVSVGKRPLTDFQDPQMKGDVNNMDFESILQVGVLCAASSSTGRPTIDLVFDELERAWKNTQAQMVLRKEMSLLSTTPSKSVEIIHV